MYKRNPFKLNLKLIFVFFLQGATGMKQSLAKPSSASQRHRTRSSKCDTARTKTCCARSTPHTRRSNRGENSNNSGPSYTVGSRRTSATSSGARSGLWSHLECLLNGSTVSLYNLWHVHVHLVLISIVFALVSGPGWLSWHTMCKSGRRWLTRRGWLSYTCIFLYFWGGVT